MLIDPRASAYIKERGGLNPSYYRILYNLISVLTLFPLVVMTFYDRGSIVFAWTGWLVLIRLALLLTAFYCFLAGAKGYDLQYFLGFQQIRDGRERVLLGGVEGFSETGIFGLVRHPWYVGSLLLIWSVYGTYFQKNFAVAVILSIYILVGTLLEERKIIAEHGELYRSYQRRVSMFFPLKWLLRR
jgi:methanethiol S-methyltransferase